MSEEVLPAGRWADVLTAGRVVLAVPLGVSAYSALWIPTAALLSLAWWSDYLDGRLARRAGGRTNLGEWDLAADTSVGAGLVLGLTAGGHVPTLVGVAAAAFGAVYVIWGNAAFAMLLQALGYGPALWYIGHESLPVLAVVVLTIGLIAVLDAGRLFGYVLPAFFRGILGGRQER